MRPLFAVFTLIGPAQVQPPASAPPPLHVGTEQIALVVVSLLVAGLIVSVIMLAVRLHRFQERLGRAEQKKNELDLLYDALKGRVRDIFSDDETRERVDRFIFKSLPETIAMTFEQPSTRFLDTLTSEVETWALEIVRQRKGETGRRIEADIGNMLLNRLTDMSGDPDRYKGLHRSLEGALGEMILATARDPSSSRYALRLWTEVGSLLADLVTQVRQRLQDFENHLAPVREVLLGQLHKIAISPPEEIKESIESAAQNVLGEQMTLLGNGLENRGEQGAAIVKALLSRLLRLAQTPDADLERMLRPTEEQVLRTSSQRVCDSVLSGADTDTCGQLDGIMKGRLADAARTPDSDTATALRASENQVILRQMDRLRSLLAADPPGDELVIQLSLILSDRLRETASRPNDELKPLIDGSIVEGLKAFAARFCAELEKRDPALAEDLFKALASGIELAVKKLSQDADSALAKELGDYAAERTRELVRGADFGEFESRVRTRLGDLVSAPLGETEDGLVQQTVRESRFATITQLLKDALDSEQTQTTLVVIVKTFLSANLERIATDVVENTPELRTMFRQHLIERTRVTLDSIG